MRTVPIVAITLDEIRTPGSARPRVVPIPIDAGLDLGWLLLHGSGESATRIDGDGGTDANGQLRLARPRAVIEVAAATDSVHLLLQFPLSVLTAESRGALQRLTPGRLQPSSLSRALTAFLTTVVAAPPAEKSAEGYAVERIIVALIEAVIANEARFAAAPTEPPVAEASFVRALAIIDAEFADPAFDVDTVAKRTGVSRRALQRTFADRNTSIAAVLRNRRLVAIATALGPDAPDLALRSIAEAAGFATADAARRAFSARFGMTMGAYRARR